MLAYYLNYLLTQLFRDSIGYCVTLASRRPGVGAANIFINVTDDLKKKQNK